MSNCKCGRHYTDQWHRWVVLQRNFGAAKVLSHRLYCLDCRAEWLSRAKYIVLLPDHVKEDRSGMTDQDILDRIINGSLIVDPHNATVCNCNNIPLLIASRTHKDGPERGTYRFVSVCKAGMKKKIALHRLVWMAHHRKLIPEGFDVDHRKSQDDDTIGNLRLLESSHNRSLGAEKRWS